MSEIFSFFLRDPIKRVFMISWHTIEEERRSQKTRTVYDFFLMGTWIFKKNPYVRKSFSKVEWNAMRIIIYLVYCDNLRGI